MMGPPEEAGVDGVVVVVVVDVVVVVEVVVVLLAGDVVVVVGGEVVVVVGTVVVVPVGGDVVVVVGGVPLPNTAGIVVVVVLIGRCRRITPENSRLPVSFASFIRIDVLTELAFGPTNVEVADASTLIHAISMLALRPNANSLRVRWAAGA